MCMILKNSEKKKKKDPFSNISNHLHHHHHHLAVLNYLPINTGFLSFHTSPSRGFPPSAPSRDAAGGSAGWAGGGGAAPALGDEPGAAEVAAFSPALWGSPMFIPRRSGGFLKFLPEKVIWDLSLAWSNYCFSLTERTVVGWKAGRGLPAIFIDYILLLSKFFSCFFFPPKQIGKSNLGEGEAEKSLFLFF